MALVDLVGENIVSIALFAFTFAIGVLIRSRRNANKYTIPKGPPTIPIFGNALSIKRDDDFLNQLMEFGRQYGSVYSLYLGSKLFVIVNGWERIKELTVDTGLDFGDRGTTVPFLALNPKRQGIFDTLADEQWKKQRKFAHTTLRGMGFGKVSLEPIIKDEVNQTIAYFKKLSKTPIHPMKGFSVGAFNVMYRLLFKRRVDHDSDFADDRMKSFQDSMISDEGVILTLFPSTWPVMKYTSKWRKLYKAVDKNLAFYHEAVRVRQERIDSCEGEPEINDFVDAYLVHRKTDPETYSLGELDNVLDDLFIAGTDTTSTTMTWAVVYLVNNPDIQQKIHEEIMREVGTEEVMWSHRTGLAYTQAALLEVQRMANVAPVIPRQASVDATLGGYHLPKGTDLFVNFWSIHNDSDAWPEPTRFDPSRFLEPNGSLTKLPKNYMPFSAGKRNCMGEQLAKMELFLFFTTVVQQLRFSVAPGTETPSYVGEVELVRRPKDYKVAVSEWDDFTSH